MRYRALATVTVVSCERLTLQEDLTTIERTTTPGYPNIRAMVNASLDEALVVVSNAAARRAAPEPGYAMFYRVFQRAKDYNLATARALDIDRESLAALTEKERQELKELAENDPELKARLVAIFKKLEREYAIIPTIKVEMQSLDSGDNPIGDRYIIESEDGFLNLGHSILTSAEFLYLVQAQKPSAERGFAIDDDWSHQSWGSGRPWPSDTVTYFFDTDTLTRSERDWMRRAIRRMQNGTGVRFRESSLPEWWLEIWQTGFASSELSILKTQFPGGKTGEATVGKIGRSRLQMDSDYVTNERWVQP